MWLPLKWPPLGTWPGGTCPDWESNWWPFSLQPALSPLSYTSQGPPPEFLTTTCGWGASPFRICAPPTGLDGYGFFNSVVVRLPFNSISDSSQFWVMVILYFSCNFDVVVRRGEPFLPMLPSFFKRFYLFCERGAREEKERDRGIETSMCGCLSPPTEDPACNPGMCPEWKSNHWPFGSHAGIHSTEPYQPGQYYTVLINVAL